jgi:ATP phosphoribosyltransferase
LKEVEHVFFSEAVLIANKSLNVEQKKILNDLLFRIKSVREAKNNKYILLNAPKTAVDKIVNILPGMNSPTIMPLVKEGWVSLHSVINEKRFWEVIGELKAAGAEGILVVPIEKMIE